MREEKFPNKEDTVTNRLPRWTIKVIQKHLPKVPIVQNTDNDEIYHNDICSSWTTLELSKKMFISGNGIFKKS